MKSSRWMPFYIDGKPCQCADCERSKKIDAAIEENDMDALKNIMEEMR